MSSIIPHSRPWITKKDRLEVNKVLKSSMISKGLLTKEFNNAVIKKIGAKYGILQATGTTALVQALKALGIGRGDNVVIPTYVCRSVLDSVEFLGANPKICDVNLNGVLDADTVSSVIDDNTKAIIAVHIFGHFCDISSLRVFSVPIIEDACQAFGLKNKGIFAGNMGDIGILSFNATKCITTAEGGMLLTNNQEYNFAGKEINDVSKISFDLNLAPLNDLQAALGLSQIKRFSEFSNRRKYLLGKFVKASNDLGLDIQTDKESNLPFRFTIKSRTSFNDVKEKFESNGIMVRRGVDELLHRFINMNDERYPNALNLFERTISIPFYPSLTDQEVERVVKSLEILKR